MVDATIPREVVEFKLVITHDVYTGAFAIEGHNRNRLVTLGMLHFAEQLVRMEIGKQRMLEEVQNASRIALPHGGPV
jgi:hypothetical protein